METRMLRAQKAEFPFTLSVPNKVRTAPSGASRHTQAGTLSGARSRARCALPARPRSLLPPAQGTVCGALYYFPFENGQETAPFESAAMSTKPTGSPILGMQPATQMGPSQAKPAAHCRCAPGSSPPCWVHSVASGGG